MDWLALNFFLLNFVFETRDISWPIEGRRESREKGGREEEEEGGRRNEGRNRRREGGERKERRKEGRRGKRGIKNKMGGFL